MMQNFSTRLQNPRSRWLILLIVILVVIVPIIFIAHNHKSSQLPKADQEQGTTFEGMSSFVDNGLTTDQVNDLIKAFSKFSSAAKTVAIDTSSVSPGPHDPNSTAPFTINFSVSIDSKPYSGTASYSDLESIDLVLVDASGKQVFDSGLITTGP